MRTPRKGQLPQGGNHESTISSRYIRRSHRNSIPGRVRKPDGRISKSGDNCHQQQQQQQQQQQCPAADDRTTRDNHRYTGPTGNSDGNTTTRRHRPAGTRNGHPGTIDGVLPQRSGTYVNR